MLKRTFTYTIIIIFTTYVQVEGKIRNFKLSKEKSSETREYLKSGETRRSPIPADILNS